MKSLFILPFLFLACTKSPSSKQKKDHPEGKETPSFSNCYNGCEPFRKQCENLNISLNSIEKNPDRSELIEWRDEFFGLFNVQTHNNVDCSNSCKTLNLKNPFKVCEASNTKLYASLLERSIDVILESEMPEIKSLQLSMKLQKLNQKKFNKNFELLKKRFEPNQKPHFYIAEELVAQKQKLFTEIWLNGKELDCLSQSTNKKIKDFNQNRKEDLENKLDILELKNQLFTDCNLNGLKALRKNDVKKLPSNPVSIKYVYPHKNPYTKDDCNYPRPRIEVRWENSSEFDLIVPKSFKTINDPELDEFSEFSKKYTWFYNLSMFPISSQLSYQGEKLIVSATPGMSTCYNLYRWTPYGLIQSGSSCSEACGS